MLVETAMSLGGLWPLKIILDNAVGGHRPPEWLVWMLGPSFIGNKVVLATAAGAIVGSINLAPGSFDSRRELAMEERDDHVVERLHKVAHHGWEHSHPLDLSDEGLLADLEDREGGGAEKLVLDAGDEKHKKNKH